IVVVNLTFGLITPPVGTSLFVGCRIARISMTEIIPPMLPQLAIMIAVLLFVTYVPESFMWLPRYFGFARLAPGAPLSSDPQALAGVPESAATTLPYRRRGRCSSWS